MKLLRLFAILAFSLVTSCCSTSQRPASISDPNFPAADTPNYEALVSVRWVKSLIDYQKSGFKTPRPPTYLNERFTIVEASWGDPVTAADDAHGHIPGAVHVNTENLEDGYPQWRLRSTEELQSAIGRAGITRETTVVVYGKELIAAARVWWILKYAGVSDIRLLDGGLTQWRAAGFPVERTFQIPEPVGFSAPISSGYLTTTDYVRQRYNRPDVWLADVRSNAEFSGRVSGYTYLDAKGRIPGSLWIGDGDDSSYIYKKRNGRLRSPAKVLAMWQRQGLKPIEGNRMFEREVVFYCGGGWRSSVAFFHAWILGFQNIRNYSDGWSGWSTDYIPDSAAKGGTPGWRQEPTGNPISAGSECMRQGTDGAPRRQS